MCASTTRYNVGSTVFISGGEIKRLAASGDVVQVEVSKFKLKQAPKRAFYCEKVGGIVSETGQAGFFIIHSKVLL